MAGKNITTIGNRKDGICLHMYSQKSSSRRAAISAMLYPKGVFMLVHKNRDIRCKMFLIVMIIGIVFHG